VRLLARQDLTLHMIDAWSSEASEAYKETNDFHAKLNQKQQNTYYQKTLNNVQQFGDRGKVIRAFSEDVVQTYKDHYFDLVFIDADHSYEGCKLDILAWTPKVKPGGWISGHDYENYLKDLKFGVTEAVNETFPPEQIELGENYTWFVKC